MAFTPPSGQDIDERITRYLTEQLGLWPPTEPFHAIAHPPIGHPRWDGSAWLMFGVETPRGTVLAYDPTACAAIAQTDRWQLIDELESADAYLRIPELFGLPDAHFGRFVIRYPASFPDLPQIGSWVPHDDPRLPEWLTAFPDDVLVVWNADGAYAAGVGLKKHSALGVEIAVGTEPQHRGQGLARTLVAQAARTIWEAGAVPLYDHGDHNAASAHVAEAAGFPDRGWHGIRLSLTRRG